MPVGQLHSEKFVEPPVRVMKPGGHDMQAVLRWSGWKRPIWQNVHTDLQLSAEKRPGGQVSHVRVEATKFEVEMLPG